MAEAIEIEQVIKELHSMRAIGVVVPFDPDALNEHQKKMIAEYFESGMKVPSIADQLCIEAAL